MASDRRLPSSASRGSRVFFENERGKGRGKKKEKEKRVKKMKIHSKNEQRIDGKRGSDEGRRYRSSHW